MGTKRLECPVGGKPGDEWDHPGALGKYYGVWILNRMALIRNKAEVGEERALRILNRVSAL